MKPVGILLAAGSARRFGAHKLLQPLPDGVPVGVAAAKTLQRVLPRVIAVVRPGDQELYAAFDSIGLELIENPNAAGGMGTSLAAGVKAASDTDGWIVALADMPWVRSGTIATLAEHLQQGASIVAPSHQGHRGNPVGFGARWLTELIRMSGDRGARSLLLRQEDQVELIDTPDAGVLLDVDHPGDLIGSPAASVPTRPRPPEQKRRP